MDILVSAEDVGDITGDLSSSRAMVCGTEARRDGKVRVKAEAPLATVDNYATRLKSMTSGEGEFTLSFARYDIVPPAVQQSLLRTIEDKED